MLQSVKRLQAEQGFTLVELLAVTLILMLVGGLLFSLLHFGINSYEKIKLEQQLREDADYLMSVVMMELYTNAPDALIADQNGFIMTGGEIIGDKAIYIEQGQLFIGNVSVEISSKLAANSVLQLSCASQQISSSCSSGLIDVTLVLEAEYGGKQHQLELISKLGF